MGFKKTTRSLDFADLALATFLEQNRSIKHMQQLSNSINWSRVESILLSHYTVGTSDEGARAYPPLMLFKCLMPQKWLRIPSDPELENQINDRLSFKTFLGLAFSQPAPDHSTFSRFRSRLPKQAMEAINSEILRQFEQQGLCINEGVAVDARLVKSASKPLSQDELKKQREHRNSEEGKRDKKGRPLKFSRDLESDWTVRNDTPHFGLKEHAAVDTRHGFVLATTLTPASVHDSTFLPYCTVFSRHTKQKIKKVYADKGYAGEPNRDFLALNHIEDGIMRKDSTTAKLTDFEIQRNKLISKIRYIVEQYFGISHLHARAKRDRFTTLIKNKFDAWFRQAAFNIARGMKILSRVSV